ncbi:MAG: helix-turn-helix domain-containing protein [Candidatus Rokubacteria bacterium]|nr:helix-turn-helix domain-containing protein [Candidatus Rokubacteria bacterium]
MGRYVAEVMGANARPVDPRYDVRTGSTGRAADGHTTGTGTAQSRVVSSARRRPADTESAAFGPRRRLLSLREAAVYLGVSPWTLRELVWKGRIPCVRITRLVQFDVRDLDRAIEAAKSPVD